MYRKWLYCSVTLFFLAAAAHADELVDERVKRPLLTAERQLGLHATPSNAKQAIRQAEVELKRIEYARSLQLVLEGIDSQKNLDKTRSEYEKSIIQAASGRVPIQTVMREIKKMRNSISRMRSQAVAARRSVTPL